MSPQARSRSLGIEEGTQLPRSIIEFYHKNDRTGRPDGIGGAHHGFRLGRAAEIGDIMALIRVNDFLSACSSRWASG